MRWLTAWKDKQYSQVAAVLSIGVRIPQETVIERMSGSIPVLTTKIKSYGNQKRKSEL
jgi:hypothetical protein